MYRGKKIAVVVPAHNEESQIEKVLRTLPVLVDAIFVVNDGSTDATADRVRAVMDSDRRVDLVTHETSRGVGAAIGAGYKRALADGFDIAVVMAGDGQMDPADLESVIAPVAAGLADYSKGNRFAFRGGLERIPTTRRLGNFALSVFTKIVSGYWHVSDTQCGYTAANRAALEGMDPDAIYSGYGCPNDMLVRLNEAGMRVNEVPVNPLYGVGERSKMRVPRVVAPILMLLARSFMRRIVRKYVLTSGHPLVFAYCFAFAFLGGAVSLGGYILVRFLQSGLIMKAALIGSGAFLIVGVQFLLSAFLMDNEANRYLCVHLRRDGRDMTPVDREV